MIRMLLAAAAACALAFATPAFACSDCLDQPKHQHKVGAAQKTDEKGGDESAVCRCAGEGKECTCGEHCQCPHGTAPKPEKEKKDGKKS